METSRMEKLKEEIENTEFEIEWETSGDYVKFLRNYLKRLKNQLANYENQNKTTNKKRPEEEN